jgi:hypothetical protein
VKLAVPARGYPLQKISHTLDLAGLMSFLSIFHRSQEFQLVFVRTLSFNVRLERKAELTRLAKREIIPLVRQSASPGELLILQDDHEPDRVLIMTFWKDRNSLLNYEEHAFPKIKALLGPFFTLPPTSRVYQTDNTFPWDLFVSEGEKLESA